MAELDLKEYTCSRFILNINMLANELDWCSDFLVYLWLFCHQLFVKTHWQYITSKYKWLVLLIKLHLEGLGHCCGCLRQQLLLGRKLQLPFNGCCQMFGFEGNNVAGVGRGWAAIKPPIIAQNLKASVPMPKYRLQIWGGAFREYS